MKKKILLIICVVLLIAAGCAFSIFYFTGDSVPAITGDSRLVWEPEATVVFKPSNAAYGAYYPRMVVLKNGDWLVAYDTNDGSVNTRCQVSRSKNRGKTWSVLSTASFGTGDAANAQMLQLKNGDILLAYRLVDGDIKTLKVSKSSDKGATWEEWSTVAEAEMDNFRGVWEPHMGFLPDGNIAVMYASEVYQPNFPQVIEMKLSKDSGKTWGEPIRVSENVLSRDGMPVWTVTEDKKVLAVFEATDDPTGAKPFIIRYKISKDGYDWSDQRRLLYSPQNQVDSRAAAPYVTALSNGVLVSSCQVDKNPGGSDMHILWSLDGGETWNLQKAAFETSGDDNWNGLYSLKNGKIAALTSTNSDGTSHIEIKVGSIQ